MKKIIHKTTGGFTLIELILYIAIVSIFLVGMTNFIWDIIYGRQKAHAQQMVEQSARIVMGRINYELQRATDFTVVSNEQVQLSNHTGTTTLSLSGNILQITTPSGGPYDLTSNEVAVSTLVFSDLSTIDENSKQLGMELILDQAQVGSAAHDANITLSKTLELNTSFNQSRSLLIDLSNVAASANNKNIEGITLENTGSVDSTLDQLSISWTGTAGGENITQVQIDGGSKWVGSQGTGSTLNLTDYVLTTVAGVIVLDSLDFNNQIDGGTFTLEFILGDGSIARAEFLIEASAGQPSPSPSPSPSSTPTPSPTTSPTTCNEYCQQNSYSTGVCRKNAAACNKNGETTLSGGNYLCTGGKNADTCCCEP